MSTSILVANGPNLNLLGLRQPEVYGRETLADIAKTCRDHAATLGMRVDFRQSNAESDLVGWIQEAREAHGGIVLNAAAYTHTSIALLDALLTVEIPIVEVHLSQIYRREEFRHHSYVSRAATGVICGFGSHGYVLALEALHHQLESRNKQVRPIQ